MLKTRIAVIVTLIVGFVGFHLVERAWHGARAALVCSKSPVHRRPGARRVAARGRHFPPAAHPAREPGQLAGARDPPRRRWTARLEEGSAGSDLAELSGAVNRLLEAADASQQELRDSERRLAAQSQALTELTSRQTGVSVTVNDRLRLILETCARTLEVARVSTWRFEDNGSTIRCDDLFQTTTGQHSSGDRLYERDVPAYFNADRPRSRRRRVRRARRSADARVQRVLPDAARHRRDARRAAAAGRSRRSA